jgi:uncharacterized protein
MGWALIARAAHRVQPGPPPWHAALRRTAFHWLAWRHRSGLTPFLRGGTSQLADLLRARPDVLGVLVWPYIHRAWGVSERLSAIERHYHFIEQQPWLHVPIGPRIRLADLSQVRPQLTLQLDRPAWFIREGELTLNLFLGALRLYSVAFSFGELEGKPVVRVGGIQGRSMSSALETYAELTKDLHGCRPRDFLVQSLFCLCASVGIDRCLAISEDDRHHRHRYFAKSHGHMPSANYDSIWRDRGGVARDDGFFEMPTELHFRHDNEIPSRKRAQYRRRYELLHRVQSQLGLLAQRNQSPDELIHEPAD